MKSTSQIISVVVFCVVTALLFVFRVGHLQGVGDVSYAVEGSGEANAEDDDRQLVEVRRTGRLSMLIYDGRSRPISGVEVDLRLTSTGESVADWIEEGLLPMSAALTDESGRLFLPPAPHGSWAWTAVTVDGRMGTGLIDLSPGETREVVGFVQ